MKTFLGLLVVSLLLACGGTAQVPAQTSSGQQMRITAQITPDTIGDACGELRITASNISQAVISYDLWVNAPDGITIHESGQQPANGQTFSQRRLNVGETSSFPTLTVCKQTDPLPGKYTIRISADTQGGETVDIFYPVTLGSNQLSHFRTGRENSSDDIRLATQIQGTLGFISDQSSSSFLNAAVLAILIENRSLHTPTHITLDVEGRQEIEYSGNLWATQGNSASHIQTQNFELRPQESRLIIANVTSDPNLRPGDYLVRVRAILPESQSITVDQPLTIAVSPDTELSEVRANSSTNISLESSLDVPLLHVGRPDSGRMFVRLQNGANGYATCRIQVRTLNAIYFFSGVGWEIDESGAVAQTEEFQLPVEEARVYTLNYSLRQDAFAGHYNTDVIATCSGETFQVLQPIRIEQSAPGNAQVPAPNLPSNSGSAPQSNLGNLNTSQETCLVTVVSSRPYVNLRTGPGTNYPVATTISNGATVVAYERTNGQGQQRWWRIGDNAWIRGDLVNASSDDLCQQLPVTR